jgi:hypothetical protein
MQKLFDQIGTFQALYAAEAWCREQGISYGSGCAGCPVGLMYGDYLVAKWRNLSQEEIRALDGRMTGNFRQGPIVIDIKDRPDAAA